MNPTGIEAANARGDMSRPELYAMIDELQETVRLCAERITSLSARAEAAEAALATAREERDILVVRLATLLVEVDGLPELALRGLIGNTNYSVLALRCNDAKATIASLTGVSSNG